MTTKPILINTSAILACVALGATVSRKLGQDIDFDQLNYHYYVAYAFLTGRLDQDVAPGQILHSFFNPIVYLPFYELVHHVRPRTVGTVLGGVQGLALWFAGLVAWQVSKGLRPVARTASVLAAVVTSAASPAGISEIGTSMSDILIAIPVIAGVAAFLSARASFGPRVFLAGLLVGAATGLKLTAAAFAIGIGIAALVGWDRWRDRLVATVTIGAGGLTGFAVTGGVWCWTLWRRFGNPFFPYFNSVFHSPDYPSDTSVFDGRFLPHGILEALGYPFQWVRVQHVNAELDFRDPRFALLIVLGLATAVLFLVQGRVADEGAPAGRRLVVFLAVAFAVWMYEWSIQRYIVPLELLTGSVMLVLLRAVGRPLPLVPAAALLAVFCAVEARPFEWSHLPWTKTWYEVHRPFPEAAQPVYFLDNENPLSYVVPALEPGATAIGVTAWEDLTALPQSVFMRRIGFVLGPAHHDALRAVSAGPPSESFKRSLAQFGLRLADDCVTTPGRPTPLTWCDVEKLD